MLIFIIVISTIFGVKVVNFSQTLEKLTGENGVTAYKILIEDSKRPAEIGGPSLCNSSLCAELREHLFCSILSVTV